jgi:hypothetical protein
MALNKKRMERSKKQSTNKQSDFSRLEEGRNYMRVFPFRHEVTESDIGKFYKEGEAEVGETYDEVERLVPVHFTDDGLVNCVASKCHCPWCSEADELLNSPDGKDKKMGKQLSARKRYFVNAVMNGNDSMSVVQLPSIVFNAVINYILDPEFGEEILGCNGRDFIIDRDKSEQPSKMYDVRIRDHKRCDKLDESLADGVVDLFRMPVLEPGWSSNGDLNMIDDSDNEDKKSDDEPTGKDKSTGKDKPSRNKAKKQKDENEFKDENEDGGEKLPWEDEDGNEDKEYKVGDRVKYVEDDSTYIGKVTKVYYDKDEQSDVVDIETDRGDEIDAVPFNEVEKMSKRKSRTRKK